jgi:hypothetical protein
VPIVEVQAPNGWVCEVVQSALGTFYAARMGSQRSGLDGGGQ